MMETEVDANMWSRLPVELIPRIVAKLPREKDRVKLVVMKQCKWTTKSIIDDDPQFVQRILDIVRRSGVFDMIIAELQHYMLWDAYLTFTAYTVDNYVRCALFTADAVHVFRQGTGLYDPEKMIAWAVTYDAMKCFTYLMQQYPEHVPDPTFMGMKDQVIQKHSPSNLLFQKLHHMRPWVTCSPATYDLMAVRRPFSLRLLQRIEVQQNRSNSQ